MRRNITRSSHSITQKSATGITRLSVNVFRHSGIKRAGGIITPDQDTQTENQEALLTELLNISEKLQEIQQRKSLEACDILTSIESTKAALVALYASIGYTTGIKTLMGEDK